MNGEIPGWLVALLVNVATVLITFFVTRHWSRLDEKRALKREFLTRLVAHRYDLQGDEFTAALNGAAVVFAESPRVASAIRRFHETVTKRLGQQRALLDMLREMIEDLGLPPGDFEDEFLLRPFNTRPSSQLPASE